MWESIGQGLATLTQPVPLMFLIGGTLLGTLVGAIPGLTGIIAMCVLLPVIWEMPPVNALPLMIGMLAVTATGDSIPAIMMGAPGDTAATASIMEGYAMSKKGQAARAMGAAFSASMLGGIFGAVVLALSVPLARPLLNQFLSPEFFMLCLLGVTLVGGLTGKSPLKGLFAGALGLLLSTIGGAPRVGHYRFTFGIPYLFTGIPLMAFALGLMALTEVADMFIKGTQIANVKKQPMGKGILQGYKDTFTNLSLVVRGSLIGAWVGFAPGIGGSTAAWMAYSQAVATCSGRPKLDKNGQVIDGYSGKFGEGDVRGLIAPEASNNAAKGGDLIPTLIFGIPGSGSMALFLMALMIIGITPGLSMMDPKAGLPLTYSIIWSLAIANIIATLVCSVLARPIARITLISVYWVIPIVLMFITYGAWQATHNWGDLILLMMFGVLGWTMKRLGWPRPPLLIGFVLGGLADQYLWISVSAFDLTWLYRPWVLGIFAAAIASLWLIMKSQKKQRKPQEGAPAELSTAGKEEIKWTFKKESIFTLLMVAASLFAFIDAATFPYGSGLYPMVIAIICVGLATSQMWLELRQKVLVKDAMDVTLEASQRGTAAMRRAVRFAAWLGGLFAGAYLLGFQIIILPWVAALMFFEGRLRWWQTLIMAAVVAVLVLWAMPNVLQMEPPIGLIQQWWLSNQ